MLCEEHGVVDDRMGTGCYHLFDRKTIHIREIEVFAGGLYRSYADVASNDLNVEVALDFPDFIHLGLELFVNRSLVNRPVLKREGLVHRPYRLVQCHH